MKMQEKYNLWLEKVQDCELRAQLEQMQQNEEAKENAFFKDLEFGTGGLRGEIGVGTNCLNIYTIGKITQGIADYMKAKGFECVAISFDSRIKSTVFAQKAATVFALNGIKAYITRELMPTPFLSYITRNLGAQIGVMITASHNPAKYNGYKVYGADGCQITDGAVQEIVPFMEKVDMFSVPEGEFSALLNSGEIVYVPDALTEKFLNDVFALSVGKDNHLKITYSALNGTGYQLVPKILARAGFQNVCLVEEQSYPNGNFTTCPYPNPEKKEALALGMQYAKANGSDILLATDPDCDRVGVAVKHGEEYVLLTGNEVGVLLTDYMLTVKKQEGTLPQNPIVLKTIVTTDLVKKIAKEHGVEIIEVLTGFKYIGEVISNLEKQGEKSRFLLGFEESYGYLSGAHVRDKDGVNAALIISQMAAYYKKQGVTLVDKMQEMYARYGLYEHQLVSYTFEGASGNQEMKIRLKNLRENLPKEIAGIKVVKTLDYLTQTEYNLPKANVLSFALEDGSKVIIRPSGTEPLVKAYLTVCFDKQKNQERLAWFKHYLNGLFLDDM